MSRRRRELDENTYLIVLGVTVGLLGGTANVLFRGAVGLVDASARQAASAMGVNLEAGGSWLVPLFPVAGVLLLIPLALAFPGQIYGYRFPDFLEEINIRGGILRKRLIIPKVLAAALTIGSGGSVGVEGPIAQLGGGLGSLTGQLLHASATRMRVLIASGVAAAIASTFNAPMTGVMFAVEIVLQGDFQLGSFVALVLATGVGTVIARAVFGMHPAFMVPHYLLHSPLELVPYVVLGVLAGAAAALFIRVFYAVRDGFARLSLSQHLKPAIGALLVGCCAIALPQVRGNGYGFIQSALDQEMGWRLMLALVAAKIAATSLSLGSGGVGGTFAPSLFVGTMLGGGFGVLAHRLWPGVVVDPGAYAMVGMAGFLAAVTQAPLTAVFLLFELTASYLIVLPVLFCVISALVVVRALGLVSIDEVELERRGLDLRAGREASVLRSVRVGDVMRRDFEVIPEGLPLRSILVLLAGSRQDYFPVVDAQRNLCGAVTFQGLREVLFEADLSDLVVAKDIVSDHPARLVVDDTLATAIELLAKRDVTAVPVMAARGSAQVVGLLQHDDVVAAYNSALLLRYGEGRAR